MNSSPLKTAAARAISAWTDEILAAIAAAIALFILVNLAGEALRGPFDTLSDWISLPGGGWLRAFSCALLAAALLVHALAPLRSPRLRLAQALLFGSVLLVSLVDAARFYLALLHRTIWTPAIVPASLLVAVYFFVLALRAARPPRPRPPAGPLRTLVFGVFVLTTLGSLPLIRMLTFGPTRYERHADCAVVLGARVWDDGTPSLALADRVDEAVRLYHAGFADKLLMSGAIDPHNGFSEPRVMRARAEEMGVPPEVILLDERGVDTASTARNTARIFEEKKLQSALLVSHYYHEPRLKMLFARAGVRAYTVPARMTRRLLKEPYFVVREVAAYYHSFLFQ